MLKHSNLNLLRTLNSYDFINKYNLKSIYLIPECKKIELKIFLKEVSNLKLTQTQLDSILFFYLYGFNNSSFKLKYISLVVKLRTVSMEAQITSVVNKGILLDFFFSFFFILNKSPRLFNYTIINENVSLSTGKPKYKFINLIAFIPASAFIERREQTFLNFKDLKIFLFFTLKQPLILFSTSVINPNISVNQNFFKNMFLFWIFL